MLLVHKKSGGVLEDLERIKQTPGSAYTVVTHDRDLSCKKLGLDPDEWWEVKAGTSLAKRLSINYPCFDPVVDKHGNLREIKVWKPDEIEDKLREKAAQIAAEAAAEEAKKWFPDDEEEL